MTCRAAVHGTASAYKNRGCRCPSALAKYRRQKKTQHLRTAGRAMDGTGTRRRIRALQAIGWPSQAIAEHCGYVNSGAINSLLYKTKRVEVGTAARVAAVYDRLCMTPGPSRRVAAYARRAGWPPPLAWDDIDDPAACPAGGSRAEALAYYGGPAVREWHPPGSTRRHTGCGQRRSEEERRGDVRLDHPAGEAGR